MLVQVHEGTYTYISSTFIDFCLYGKLNLALMFSLAYKQNPVQNLKYEKQGVCLR